MSETRGVLVIGSDAVLTGDVTSGARVEVHGVIQGGVTAGEVVVHPGGRVAGKLNSDSADIQGTLQGDVRVQNLITIKSTGNVSGTVKYGRLAMEEGAELAANVRNLPPSISGDLDLTVPRSGSVRITRADLSAFDPDDAADQLTFNVSNASGGFVARTSSPHASADTFTQAELEAGAMLFVHDGNANQSARFDVVVADPDGATSGKPKTVNIAIRA